MATHSPTVFISGVHSDPDPSPGVGVAKSLREGFPDAKLVGVDYSIRSSGLHHPVFDRVLVQPVWNELDLPTYVSQIQAELGKESTCWISGLDVEVDWLAASLGNHPRLLIPTGLAQAAIRKPDITAATDLGMEVPPYVSALASPTDLHAIGRRSGWQVWVKGKYHEAYRAWDLSSMQSQIGALAVHWPLNDIFVQQNISGTERAIAFAAHRGRLLDAVEVEKRSVTARGKTWAAQVSPPSPSALNMLSNFVKRFDWTGGGEVEFVRDSAGRDHLIDFNPRFPAYIHGVTLCGRNLPAKLVAAELGLSFTQDRRAARQFIRVVEELPVREDLPLPPMLAVDTTAMGAKHPSFQPMLVRRLSSSRSSSATLGLSDQPVTAPSAPPLQVSQLSRTPRRIRPPGAADAAVAKLLAELENCDPGRSITPAMSVKTDPSLELAHAFLGRGCWAEVISKRELHWAIAAGFDPSHIIVNGPRAVEVARSSPGLLGATFADSVEALDALLALHSSVLVGLRVRVGSVRSRFGIDLTNFNTFERVVRALASVGTEQRCAIHMHFASDVTGGQSWLDFAHQMLAWAQALGDASGVSFSAIDLGGGWHADDFTPFLLSDLPLLRERIFEEIPTASMIFIEPGKAVASELALLVTRVVEVRESSQPHNVEVVVDASIADLPMARLYAHQVWHYREGRPLGTVTGGSARILGAICMESDILADGIGFNTMPRVDDELVFGSAGGYNASMAWNFAEGVARDSHQ